MHGGDSMTVVELGERRRRWVHRRLGFLNWGFRRRMARGMAYIRRKYLVLVGYNDELKKLFVTIATII
jgi:hypothetical protein